MAISAYKYHFRSIQSNLCEFMEIADLQCKLFIREWKCIPHRMLMSPILGAYEILNRRDFFQNEKGLLHLFEKTMFSNQGDAEHSRKRPLFSVSQQNPFPHRIIRISNLECDCVFESFFFHFWNGSKCTFNNINELLRLIIAMSSICFIWKWYVT